MRYAQKIVADHDYLDTAESLKECYNSFYKEKDYGYAIFSLDYAAYCLINVKKFSEAKVLVDLAFEKVNETGYESNELMTDLYYLYALIFYDLGNPELSIHFAEKYIDMRNKYQSIYLHHIAYQNIGFCNLVMGDYDRSITNFKEAIRLSPNNMLILHSRIMSSISEAYLKLDDLKNAKLYLDLSREKLKEFSGSYDYIYLYEEMSKYFIKINELDSAQYYIDKANKLKPRFHEEVNLLQIQGKLNLSKNNIDATSNYVDAIRISRDSLKFNKYKTSQVYLNTAKSYMDIEQNQNAILHLNNSIKSVWENYNTENDVSNILNHRLVSEALILKSIALARENKFKDAKITFERSLSVINYLLKSKITSWESATHFSSKIKTSYSKLIKEATTAGDFDFAFSITQSMHAILLSLKLDDIKAIDHFNLNKEHTKNINKLKIDISKENTNLLNIRDNKLLNDSLESAIFYKQRHLDSLINVLEQSNPAYYNLKYAQSKSLTPNEIQNNFLSKSSALIEYFMAEDHLYTFIISKNVKQILTTPIDSNFTTEINNLNTSIRSIDGGFNQFVQSSTFLYDKLLDDALTHLGPSINTLYIIPDNEINYVPFDVLISNTSGQTDNGRYDLLPYLINDYTISYHYSSALLNSDNTSLSNNLTGFAPSFKSSYSEVENLESLLYNQKEVLMINDITDGQINIDTAANLNNLKESVNNYKIAHLATHATCNDTLPFESKIYLEDGPLHAYEIYNMPHQLNLAVLSACDTGTGELKKGEGLMSLARAFISSGCNSVITSLWTVNDRNSVQIMERFYKHLYDGQTVSESLTHAKRDYLKSVDSVREAHPYHWATYIMIGHGELAIPGIPWTLLFILLVVLLAILYLVRKFFTA